MDVPVVSSMPKGNVDGVFNEWQTDSLASTDTGNAHVQGDDIASFPAVSPTTRVGNRTQISRKLVVIADTQEVIDKAGRQSEMAYQVAKKGRELKRDIEAIVLSSQAAVTGSSAVAPKTAALGAWLNTNENRGSGGDGSNHTSGQPGTAPTDGTQRALTETIFKDVVKQVWASGGNPDSLIAFAGPVNKQKISGFAGVVSRSFDISNAAPRPTAVIAAVDVYVSDFGTVRILPSRFQRERDLYFLDFEYLRLDHLRPFKLVKLAKTGDAEKRMLIQEWGLRVQNEAAHGIAADLTTT